MQDIVLFIKASKLWASLCEQISRIYLLEQFDCAYLNEIKLLCTSPVSSLERSLVEKIAPANIKLFPLDANHLYRIKTLIFPAHLNYHGSFYLPETILEKLRADLLPKRSRNKKIVFISLERLNLNARLRDTFLMRKN
ncbi:MAG: glycosyltransferase family 61 protein [Chloroflexaceae bacterium]|nr:glycosyltransferase family 61 protein [Chloroflexaceae bacterium]